ncbi:MLO-like protein 11 [Populus alba x Populus x berolinensis]|uniref:MLO-like protein 11 n=1 Tax=Populus alba x Populus x berolinensis TaxID=444605 RepID=A0AAD6M6N4_9ROSI|nr:MLO-like protein 11 [Populus alba x Populus x berolinensis]
MRPRDDLFWFKKPELYLSLIHFILFQNAFELASFFWFWWQFGYRSCFIRNHLQVYIRLVLGFAGQFLCSYSTLPLYALVTQMGTNYKAALFPPRIRETIFHGWWKAETSGKRRHAIFTDDSTMHRDTSTLMSEEDNHHLLDIPENDADPVTQVELQPASFISVRPTTVANETSSGVATPFLRHSASVSSSETSNFHVEDLPRSSSMQLEGSKLDLFCQECRLCRDLNKNRYCCAQLLVSALFVTMQLFSYPLFMDSMAPCLQWICEPHVGSMALWLQ